MAVSGTGLQKTSSGVTAGLTVTRGLFGPVSSGGVSRQAVRATWVS